MKISLYLSSQGGSPLQVGLHRGLLQLGHDVGNWHDGFGREGCDLVLVFNQCSHTTHYAYPDFPSSNQPIAFVDTAEYGYFKRLPAVAKQYQNTFSPGAMAHDTKNPEQQGRLKQFLQGRSFPYLIREYVKFLEWPESYHPIDYPLYALSECPERPDREQFLSRPLDLYVRWGASHPWRRNLSDEMRMCRVKSDISIIDEPLPRIPQDVFFNLMRSAKCSVSFDGYGSSSFRLHESLVRSVLIRGPLSIKMRDDLTDGVNCLEFGIRSNGEEFLHSDVCNRICEVWTNPERAYRIYEAGYAHCTEHYTERATAAYLLRIVENHDWAKPTPLDL